MPNFKRVPLSEITPDEKNANQGTERGKAALDTSLQKYGAGRSILLDSENRIIAGNQTFASAGELGFENVLVVETDGTEIIAVKRKDLNLDEKAARELAYADNRVSQMNLFFNKEQLREDWENPELELGAFFNEREIDFFTSNEEESLWQEEEEETEVKVKDYALKVQFSNQEERDKLAEQLQEEGYIVSVR